MPTVSVIIPTYKHRDYVLQTLNSVFAQTFLDYEVIVVNDGSPDDTAQLLRPLAETGRIRYIEQKNQGQAAARNRGLAETKSEFIAFLDDDDLWPPDKLKWQVEFLNDHMGYSGVGGTCITSGAVPDTTEEQGKRVELTAEQLFFGNPFFSPGQVLLRRGAVVEQGGLSQDIWGADDFDLYFRVVRSAPIMMVSRPSLFYRLHANNASKDLMRMHDNSVKCIRRNLRFVPLRRRFRMRRRAYRWLYGYVGARLLANEAGCAGARLNQFRVFLSILPALALDPRLTWRVISLFGRGCRA